MSNSTAELVQKKLARGNLILLPTEDRNVSDFAADLGNLIKTYPIFLKGEIVVEARGTGELIPMDPDRFCTWVEQYVATCAAHDMK